mgnify:FL=1
MNIPSLAVYLLLSSAAPAEAAPEQQAYTNSIGMKLVRIAPGEFHMGRGQAPPTTEAEWSERDWDESPVHKVRITKAFFLGATEVTNAQFEKFDPRHEQLRGVGNASVTDEEPVTMVTWQQAVDFCQWLSKQEGRTYRLPTEAEWEYACRAGTASRFHTGEGLTDKQANIAGDRRHRTQPVESFQPNAWGLYDMHGNVEEWCWDWYGPYAAEPETDPVGRDNGYVRVTRGGSYDVPSWQKNNARYARSANRSGRLPENAKLPHSRARAAGPSSSTRNNPEEVTAPPPPKDAANDTRSKAPYFDDFANRRPTIPENTWGPIFSAWNHFAACCVCPNGDVLACWYTTKSESGRELAQASARLPAGSNHWQPATLFFDVPDVNDHAPVLLTHRGRIFHFASQSLRGWDETSNIMRTSDDNGKTWSPPRIIFRREGPHNLSQACSAFATADGTIYLAVDGSGHRTESLLVSRDEGQTWRVAAGDLRKAMEGKYAIHSAIAPGSHGSILAFLRGPDPLPRLVSTDHGATWSASNTPFGAISVGQKAAALRLKSGALLLCARDARQPPLTGKRGTLVALSYDDGQSWPHIRHLPAVGGYLSAAQGFDGLIYVFGSRMSCVAVNEAWVQEPAAER